MERNLPPLVRTMGILTVLVGVPFLDSKIIWVLEAMKQQYGTLEDHSLFGDWPVREWERNGNSGVAVGT